MRTFFLFAIRLALWACIAPVVFLAFFMCGLFAANNDL